MTQDLHSMAGDSAFYGSSSVPVMVIEGICPEQSSDHNAVLEHGVGGNTTMMDTKTPASSKTKEESPFYETSPTDVMVFADINDQHNQTVTGEKNVDQKNMLAETTTDSASSKEQESEFDAIAREAAILLDKKLDNNRGWAKKLLREITVYVKTLEEVQAEYVRIQRLEHQESERLDQVEPDVQGATSHLLEHTLLGSSHHALNSASITDTYSGETNNIPGAKRRRDSA
jgi:hypothetical protein